MFGSWRFNRFLLAACVPVFSCEALRDAAGQTFLCPPWETQVVHGSNRDCLIDSLSFSTGMAIVGLE
jgi:hypothetical protein